MGIHADPHRHCRRFVHIADDRIDPEANLILIIRRAEERGKPGVTVQVDQRARAGLVVSITRHSAGVGDLLIGNVDGPIIGPVEPKQCFVWKDLFTEAKGILEQL